MKGLEYFCRCQNPARHLNAHSPSPEQCTPNGSLAGGHSHGHDTRSEGQARHLLPDTLLMPYTASSASNALLLLLPQGKQISHCSGGWMNTKRTLKIETQWNPRVLRVFQTFQNVLVKIATLRERHTPMHTISKAEVLVIHELIITWNLVSTNLENA